MTDSQPPGGHDGPSERPNEKRDVTGGVGIGLGLIIGWSAISIGTLGICTGLNPALYQDT